MPSPRLRHEAIFLLVFALDLVNMFIATVAYPALAAELHADISTLAWVGTAYMLGLSVVIPLAPWLAARCGERRLLLVALLLFAVAAVLAGAAPGIGWLLGWRLLQGLAGGLLIPVAQAAAYRQCTSDQRGALTRRILLVALLVPALAPALGGVAGAVVVLARRALGQPAVGGGGDRPGAGLDAGRWRAQCAAPAGLCAVHRDAGAGRAAAGVDLAG